MLFTHTQISLEGIVYFALVGSKLALYLKSTGVFSAGADKGGGGRTFASP